MHIWDIFIGDHSDDDYEAWDHQDWLDMQREEEDERHAELQLAMEQLERDQEEGFSEPIIDAWYDAYVSDPHYVWEPVALVNGLEIPISEIARYADAGYEVDVFGV